MLKMTYGEMTNLEESFAQKFEGWKIEKIGMTSNYTRDGRTGRVEGGLTFILSNGKARRKVILGYTELGEWIEFDETLVEEA